MALVALEPGDVFAGDYRVVRRLSQGGMGAVYVVSQLSTGKDRALKLMHPQLVADASLRRRFEQEARVGSHIESEHVVEVQVAGIDAATGTPYLVMELLKGEDLASRIARSGPMTEAEMLSLFEQLCHAVSAAHAADIVHRDLKPENIFLSEAKRAGASLVVKVVDFGIAKIAAEAEAKSKSTAAMGSPMWMAPEQTERGTVTPAADVWALGLIAFYVSTGKSYWVTANEEETGIAQLMREVLFAPMPAASERARDYGASLPTWFDEWFLQCTSREPSSRFPNAARVWSALSAKANKPAAVSGTLAATVPTPAPSTRVDVDVDNHSGALQTTPSGASHDMAATVIPRPWPRSRFALIALAASLGLGTALVAVKYRRGAPVAQASPAVAVTEPVVSITTPSSAASTSVVLNPVASEFFALGAPSASPSGSAMHPAVAPPPATSTAIPATAEAEYNALDAELRSRFDLATGHLKYSSLTPVEIFGEVDQRTGNFTSTGRYQQDAKTADSYDARLRHVSDTYDSSMYQAAAAARRGSLYDSLRTALYGCSGPTFKLFTPAQETKLSQLRASGRDELVDLADDIEAKVKDGWRKKRDSEIDAADRLMVRNYSNAARIADANQVSHPGATRAKARLAYFTDLIGDAKMRSYMAASP